jgi:hypothetical protein
VDCGPVEGAKHLVKVSKCALGPYDEATNVATWCKLKEVKATDVDYFNTRKVAERFDNTTVLVVDNERTAALAVTAIAHLSLTRAKLSRVRNLYNVAVRTKGPEKCNGLLCLLEGLNGITDDQGNLLNLLNAMSTSENQRGKCRGCESRNCSEAALVLVHLDVPSAPGLCRSEHPTTAAHIAKRCLIAFDKGRIYIQHACTAYLTRAVSAPTTDTGNTSNGTTSTPGLGGSLVACLFADSISLTLVLGNALLTCP